LGWRDRDWAQLDKSERKSFYNSGVRAGRGGIRRGSVLLAAGITCALALVAGRYPHGHPLIPGLDFRLPFTNSAHSQIRTITVTYGSTYTLAGTTPNGKNGTVKADGSWNGGPWQFLTDGTATNGAYVVRFPITEHGSLKLRVKYPGGEADGTVRVP
jgi:hypothetical protein